MEQFKSVIASELERAFNPLLLFERLELQAQSWQRDILSLKHHDILLLASRQSGKTLVSLVLIVGIASLNPKSTVLFLSGSARQSEEQLERCYNLLVDAGYADEVAKQTKSEIRFKNRSRVLALPDSPSKIRGYSNVSALVIDEAAFVQDELFVSASPFLVANPNAYFICISSAGRPEGYFYEQWSSDNDLWKRFEIPYYECKHIHPETIEKEKKRLSVNKFRAEYCCEFVGDGGEFISAEAFDKVVIPGLGVI